MINPHIENMCSLNYLICFALLYTFCDTYKILVVFPYPSRSHGYLGDGVVRNLLKAEHEVTYISPFPYAPPSPNLRMIDVSDNAKLLPDVMYNFKSLVGKTHTIEYSTLTELLIKIMKHTVENENVQKFLNNRQEYFDAVIIEWLFTEIPTGFAAVFNCPYIWISSFDTHWLILRLIDQSPNPAYIGDVMSSNLPPFTFWERATELYKQLRVNFLKYMYFDKLEQQEYENLFTAIVTKRGRKLPPYNYIKFNASLILGNSHTSMGKTLSLPQNYISVGGYYIEEELKPIPENLKIIMDNATNGVIYFSMGSNLKSKDIPKEIQESILKMFSELNQTVLWKFEGDLDNIPQNVHIMKWVPQHSVLAHPNTILFISHGGLLSTTEAVHFGVPIIGIPVFLDQAMNIANAVKRGNAKRVDISYNIATDMKATIEEVISNKTYAAKAKEMSFIYHDRPLTPGKELERWVRHIIQTGGAQHLRSPALHVPLYQILYLDLLAVVLIIIYAIVRFVIFLIYCTTNYLNYNAVMDLIMKRIHFVSKIKKEI